jgi:streptogramin lyase
MRVEQLEDRLAPHSGVTQFTNGITANAGLTGIVQGPDDNFWFTEFNASRVSRITATGTVTEFTLPAGRGPVNITVGPDNNIWFTENTGDRIGRLNPLAGNDAAIQASIMEFAVTGAGSNPNDIATGPDGALWFTQTGSDQIGRITTAGVVTEFAVPGAGSAPAGITAGSDGALWFTQAGSGQIGRITTAGVVTEFTVPVQSSTSFSDPEDIVSGPGGHLYFTDFGRDQIGRITTAGVFTQFNLAEGRGPQQIVAAPDGNLYFTEAGAGRLGRLPANALNPGRPTSGSPPLEEFDFIARDSVPLGIAVSNSDDVFFTLNGGNAIATFEAHLAQITAAAAGPTIQVFDIELNPVRTFTPFAGFQGELSLAVMDMAGAHSVGGATNGVPDVIVGAGVGGHVKVFDGSDNAELASFFAFPGFNGAVTVGADDVNGDGRNDLVVAALGHVKVIDGTKLGMVQANGVISDAALLASFFAFSPGTMNSVSLAVGDLNRDGKAEIIVGAGVGSAPHVKVINGANFGLLASFFAFAPSFTGGVSVAVAFNVGERNLVVGAGPGAAPHVKVIDVDLFGTTMPDGQIPDSALLANFFAFDPAFLGGVRVAADDLTNADGVPELILSAGPGAGPAVKVLNGAMLNQVDPDGEIANSAVLSSFLAGPAGFTGGVSIAADADHRDGPIFGPPGITVSASQRDINDVYIFQSPTNTNNTVMAMTVTPFSSATTQPVFAADTTYDFRIANRNIVTVTDDRVFRVTFGPVVGGVQDVLVRALPAALFPGVGGVLVKGLTGTTSDVRGVGGTGAQFLASEQDDPFLFDAGGFANLLNNAGGTAVSGVVAGAFPRGTSPNGFGPGSTPNFNAPNTFGPNANTLALTLEVPSSILTAAGSTDVGFWGRAELNSTNVQIDRMGRPAINTAVIPPIPRGSLFPINSSSLNRNDVRNAFNAIHPRDDRTMFGDDMVSVLTAFYPAGRPGGTPNAAQAGIVANLLLPDILVYDVTSAAGFGGDLVSANGETFIAGGRKLSDDVVSTELFVLTDDDLPAFLGGGTNQPALVTQNVRDDNRSGTTGLMDGSIVGPGSPDSGTQRLAVFPYFGPRNTNPQPAPAPAPPP